MCCSTVEWRALEFVGDTEWCETFCFASGLKNHADRLFGVTFNVQFRTPHVQYIDGKL